MFFALVPVLLEIIFWPSINTHTGDYGHPMAAIGRAAHNVIHEEAHTNERFISFDEHQLYAFNGRGIGLELEGLRYIEMHRWPHIHDTPASNKGQRSQSRGRSHVSL